MADIAVPNYNFSGIRLQSKVTAVGHAFLQYGLRCDWPITSSPAQRHDGKVTEHVFEISMADAGNKTTNVC